MTLAYQVTLSTPGLHLNIQLEYASRYGHIISLSVPQYHFCNLNPVDGTEKLHRHYMQHLLCVLGLLGLPGAKGELGLPGNYGQCGKNGIPGRSGPPGTDAEIQNFAAHIRISYHKHSVFQALLVTLARTDFLEIEVLMDTLGIQELWGFQASSFTPMNLKSCVNTMMLQMSVISHVQMCSSCRSKRPQRFTWCPWGDWDSWCPRTKWTKGDQR